MQELEVVPFHPELDSRYISRNKYRRVRLVPGGMTGRQFLVEGVVRIVMSTNCWLTDCINTKDTVIVRLSGVPRLQVKRMRCRDIDDAFALRYLCHDPEHDPELPYRLVMAKLRRLVKRGLVYRYVQYAINGKSESYGLTVKGNIYLANISK